MAEVKAIDIQGLKSQSNELRVVMLEAAHKAGGGHLGGAFSVIDILLYLYSQVLTFDPNNPNLPNRDRLILSKGHSCLALYACMEEFGFLSPGELMTFLETGSRLAGHSEHFLIPGVEVTTGSLGHGLGISAGIALAGKKQKAPWKVFCILGDGECNEGSIWESLLFVRQHSLNNLITIIDYNKQESLDRTENILSIDPLPKKVEAFGLIPLEIDGHSFKEIESAFATAIQSETPVVIIANTIKGYGVDFMEEVTKWHYRGPTQEELNEARIQLKERK
jgi:transketolase